MVECILIFLRYYVRMKTRVIFLILILYICDVFCEWLAFADFFKHDKTDTANIIRARANCGPGTIQIIPGDCRPQYKVIKLLYTFMSQVMLSLKIN